MTPTWDCTDARLSLGVYVLGAIDPAERALVDAHLVTCRDCRDELAGLAGLPALLARVNPDEISRICADDTVRTVTDDRPPGELIGTVLDLAEARRRRTRWRFLAAAAAVVAIAGGLFGGLSSIGTRTVVVPFSVRDQPAPGKPCRRRTASPELPPPSPTRNGRGATRSRSWSTTFRSGPRASCGSSIPTGRGPRWPPGRRLMTRARSGTQARCRSTAEPISSFQITANQKVLLTATPT